MPCASRIAARSAGVFAAFNSAASYGSPPLKPYSPTRTRPFTRPAHLVFVTLPTTI